MPRSMATRESLEPAAPESPAPRSERFVVPWDLSEWVDRAELLRWTVEHVDTLDWANPGIARYLAAHPEARPKMMLQLITYAYATGSFSSPEVAALFYDDRPFGTLGWDKPPKPRSVAKFRRENRGLLKWALLQVLLSTVRSRFELPDRPMPGLRRLLEHNAVERVDLARHLDRSAAED